MSRQFLRNSYLILINKYHDFDNTALAERRDRIDLRFSISWRLVEGD